MNAKVLTLTPSERAEVNAELIANITDPVSMILRTTVSFVATAKGGVGKSQVCSFITEWLQSKHDMDPLCIDTDTNNKTLSRYAAYRTVPVTLLDPVKKTIDYRAFDAIVEFANDDPMPIVVDIGANSYDPLLTYLVSGSDALGTLEELGRTVVFHAVVAGGNMLGDTAQGLLDLHKTLPGVKIVVWLNGFSGSTDINGRPFVESETFAQVADACIGVVTLRSWMANSEFQMTVLSATAKYQPVWGQMQDKTVAIMERGRIKKWAGDAFDGLARIDWSPLAK